MKLFAWPNRLRSHFVLALGVLACPIAQGYMGGFEADDGYRPFLHMVQTYNAGQYGANTTYGGSYTPITPNTGLYTAINGGFFSGGAVSYATGHQWFDRMWVNHGIGSMDNQGLILTTGHEGYNGPALKYGYKLDSDDLDGFNPLSTGGTQVSLSLWWCAGIEDPVIPDGYFGDEIQLLDSIGNVGVSIGLTQRGWNDKVTYWNGSSMFESSIVVAYHRFDRIDFYLDLAAGTFSLDYYSFPTNTLHNLVVNGALMNPMSNFTQMTMRTYPGITNAKIMAIDDVNFTVVPEPLTLLTLAAGVGMVIRRRRR